MMPKNSHKERQIMVHLHLVLVTLQGSLQLVLSKTNRIGDTKLQYLAHKRSDYKIIHMGR